MKRRDLLSAAAAATVSLPLERVWGGADSADIQPAAVMTVTGEVAADQLGKMLPHEHVLVDFVGADQVSRERYDAEEAFNVMLPFVRQAKDAGCSAIASRFQGNSDSDQGTRDPAPVQPRA